MKNLMKYLQLAKPFRFFISVTFEQTVEHQLSCICGSDRDKKPSDINLRSNIYFIKGTILSGFYYFCLFDFLRGGKIFFYSEIIYITSLHLETVRIGFHHWMKRTDHAEIDTCLLILSLMVLVILLSTFVFAFSITTKNCLN